MGAIIEKENIMIEDMIYEVRGKQVMLDSDLAKLYNCKNGTKTINLAVKRHLKRFPERFMFQLTKEEYYTILRFQFETLNKKANNGKVTIKYLPYLFTEQGITMLAGVLKSEIAVRMSIKIIKALLKTVIKKKLIKELI